MNILSTQLKSGTIYNISLEDKDKPSINWKRQVNGEPSSPIVHDIDEEQVYFSVQSAGK